MSSETIEAIIITGALGGFAGLIGGYFGRSRGLIGSVLVGIIGGISLSAILRIAGYPPIIGIGDDFSLVYAFFGGLVLGFVVGRSG
jgi:uncharacterized membrane protein YeaQ/YmgE (transglycosylase-associated protein family)